MLKNYKLKSVLIIIGVLILGSVSYGAYYWWPKNNKPVACTREVKQCPDGSYVSRTGPNCEFAPCPEVKDETANWQTYRNEEYGYEFKYPGNLIIKETLGGNSVFLEQDKKSLLSIETEGAGMYTSKMSFEEAVVFLAKLRCEGDSPAGATYCSDNDIIKKPVLINNVKGYEIYLMVQIKEYGKNISTNKLGPLFMFDVSKETNNAARIISIQHASDETLEKIISTFKFTK